MDYLFMGILDDCQHLTEKDVSNYFQVLDLFLQYTGKEMHPTYDTREMALYLLNISWISEKNMSPSFYVESSNPATPSKKMVNTRMKNICGKSYPAFKKLISDSCGIGKETTDNKFVQLIALITTAYKLYKDGKISRELIKPYLATYGVKEEEANVGIEKLKSYLFELGAPKLETFI